MTHQWEVSFDDGDSWAVVTPLNDGKLRIQRKRDLDAGQIFFRKYINQSILFGKGDYPQFLAIERQPSRRCNTILVRLQLKCANNYREYWRGKFSTGGGTFNLSECTFEVKPDTVDKYSCVLKQMNKRVNALSTDASTAKAVVLPSGMDILISETPIDDEFTGWMEVDTQTVTWASGIGLCSDTVHNYHIYWRESVYTLCADGHPVSPNGEPYTANPNSEGWWLIPVEGDGCDVGQNGRTKWARQPSVAWPWPDNPLHIGPYTLDPAPIQPPSDDCSAWMLIGIAGCAPGIAGGNGYRAGIYICVSEATPTVSYPHARKLINVFNFMIQQFECGPIGIRSDFLGINPPGDAVGYVAGENYITGDTTQTEGIMLIQKSDAIDPSASNPARLGELTFTDLMGLLLSMRLYWDIDDSGNIRIEHWKYWTSTQGLDITAADENKKIEPLSYNHLNADIPRFERVKWMEARNSDFVGDDIVYDSTCVNSGEGRDVKEYNIGMFTSDISMIHDNPDAVSKEGFAVIATIPSGDEFIVILTFGAISGALATNASLSTANLQRDYWTWDRFLPNGNMNGQDVTFDGFIPNIEQKGVSFPSCCDELAFDATKSVITTLGHLLGDIPGTVEEYEFDPTTGRATMTLRYSY